jgi:DNA-binding GntR family transcriptional regulator
LDTKNNPVNNEGKNRRHYQTKQQMAYDIIRRKILDGTYKPQQHLKMINLTKEIGISSIPIREALKQLEDEGLVKFNLHRGVQVVLYSPEEFEHLYMIRAVLEGLAGRMGTQNITEADINRMKNFLKKMVLVSKKSDFNFKENGETFSQFNNEFHQILYQAANCQQLLKMITNLWGNTHNNVAAGFAPKFIPDYFEQEEKHHNEIIDGVTSRLPELVEQVIKNRIIYNGKVVLQYLKHGNFMMES